MSTNFKNNSNFLSPALTSLFDEADTSNDGKISIDEYLQLTKNYGIEVCFYHQYFKKIINIQTSDNEIY